MRSKEEIGRIVDSQNHLAALAGDTNALRICMERISMERISP
jgi:hypothetical protein